MHPIENLLQVICSYLLPSACIVCGIFQQHTLCLECAAGLATEQLSNYECCQQCGLPLQINEISEQRCLECVTHPPYFDATYCLDRYEGKLQSALHQLKYQRRLACAHGLASAWGQLMAASLSNLHANYLLPVPLSQEKLCARGFNQSWELARRIHCASQINKNPYILLRHHHTQHQANETRINRYKAIEGMFYINPQYWESLESTTVIVFDDVMTSGATLNEIAYVLKDNGVSRVINWVLLRTLRPA
ncbi:ComF family protein [Polynucleobacter sp. CS-Odin-A6]|uniref:ComF family protein n=1 Tax=Polynucleobacter sp. CS-Odin-A6 TaxID=2689106 RepID=UPI001C0D7579|nr:ComF family protein [Polynucleobacter sp. CS-Odin-A6]MBU3620112.1 ComF family protein [Polynucleobacter sp. CS-Odin-A6]